MPYSRLFPWPGSADPRNIPALSQTRAGEQARKLVGLPSLSDETAIYAGLAEVFRALNDDILVGGGAGPAAAGTLTGATLAANVLASSLTSVGTLASLAVTGAVVIGTDPGGSQLLRVGGGIRTDGQVDVRSTTTEPTFVVTNTQTGNGSARRELGWFRHRYNSGGNGYDLRVSGQGDRIDLMKTWGGTLAFAVSPDETAVSPQVAIDGAGAVVIGTDPGGSELLRVGGGIRTTSDIMIASSAVATMGTVTNHPFRVATNNTARWEITTTGHLVALADNSFDIGASGASRPRTVYASTSVVVGTDPGGSELLRVGGGLRLSALRLYAGQIEEGLSNGLSAIAINYNGFNGGTTQFRNLDIYDGKNAIVASFAGGNKEMTVVGSAVIGTDPGGSETLRVGGSLRVNGDVVGMTTDRFTLQTASPSDPTSTQMAQWARLVSAGFPVPLFGVSDALGSTSRDPFSNHLGSGVYDRFILSYGVNASGVTNTGPNAMAIYTGSATMIQQTAGSIRSETPRQQWTSNTSGSGVGAGAVSSAIRNFWRGNAAGRGGFICRFIFSLDTLTANARVFVALTDDTISNNVISNGDPSSRTTQQTIGIVADKGDSNITIGTCNGTTFTKTAFTTPRAKTTAALYELTIACAPNSSSIRVRVVELSSSDYTRTVLYDADLTSSSNIPLNTAFLRPVVSANGADTVDNTLFSYVMIYGAWKAP